MQVAQGTNELAPSLTSNESGVKKRRGTVDPFGWTRPLLRMTRVWQRGPSVCLEGAWELLRAGRGEDAGELFRPCKGQQIAGGRLVYPVFLSVQYPDPPRGNRI